MVKNNTLKADLHIHTYFSDGINSPELVVQKAKEYKLDIISITDHDNLDGIPQAIEYGLQIGIEVIPGVEISAEYQGKEIHILGYFIDLQNDELNKFLSFSREERFYRAKRIIKKLNTFGINISIEDVILLSKSASISRPHIALALKSKGFVKNYYEAFYRFIGDNGPAYEKKVYFSPESAIKIISEAGGLSFIAHPGKIGEDVLLHLIECGLDGVEVVHPSHNKTMTKFYKDIAEQYYLLQSGGSDYHGGDKDDEKNFGKYYISTLKVENMKKMIHKNIG